MVVNALDKCISNSNIGTVLGLISSAKSSRLRIFLTCRPEMLIQYGILSINEASCQVLVLHHIDLRVINRDIYTYLASKLRRVGREYYGDSRWLNDDPLHKLVQYAGGLFIWAATACNHICQGKAVADARLREVLQSGTDMVCEKHLNDIYVMVLNKALSGDYGDDDKKELFNLLQVILGTIAVH
jgi:hypothetical protein